MTELFIKKAEIKHGKIYNYSKSEYKDAKTKLLIICNKHNFEFWMTPTNHLSGQKCKECSMENRKKLRNYGNEGFKQKAIEVHGNKYDYSKVNYVNSKTIITIICKEHGEFTQRPDKHLQGHNCILCSNKIRAKNKSDSNEIFIKKAIEIHGYKYNYSKVNYVNSQTKIIIICSEHGEFIQIPANHLQGNGCNSCGNILRKNKQILGLEIFINRSKILYEDNYDYSKTDYINIDTICVIKCKKHNYEFWQTPYNHLNYIGCKKCSGQKHSYKSIQWLNFISIFYNIHIKHAENAGEYKILDTKYNADGYCENTNTIYEFHGDLWHGNPKIYNSIGINPISKKNFGELYQKTLEREQFIRNLGYNLVVMWEYDWNKINKSIKTLQRKFRNFKLH